MKSLIDRGVDRFEYVYDFGDNWIHDIIIEGVRDGEADVDYPAFVDGARRGPPEDVGGRNGFMEFLEAVLDPRDEAHDRMLEWYDPFDIDEKHVRRILSCFADRRPGPLASHRNGSRRKAS